MPPNSSATGEPPPLPPPVPLILPYARAEAGRPGILTAVGIISICLGGISGIMGTCGTFQSAMYMTMRSVTKTLAPATMATTTSVVVTSQPAATTAPVILPFQNIATAPLVASAVTHLLHAALALYLLTAGIMVLRDRFSARRHHQRYAVAKIALVVLGGAVEAWSQYSIQQAFLGSMPQSPVFTQPLFMLWITIGSVAVTMAFSLAYPIALLIIMRLRQVQAYYAMLVESGIR